MPPGTPWSRGWWSISKAQERFAHAYQLVSLDNESAKLSVDPQDLGSFERRPGEMLLGRDLRSRHLIHLEGARLVRANEIELAKVGTTWQVMGVDTGSRPVLRRLLPRRFRHLVKAGRVVDWSDIEPFVAHVPTARLQIPFRKLRRMHPAKLADLVEAASHDEGEEIIRAVGVDRELEADVFEELDTEHQLEFLRARSDEEAARLLSVMAPDDAVDLLTELDQERRLPILQRLPPVSQAKLRRLLSYNPETAGGLMNPDFIAVPAMSTVGDAIKAVRSSPTPPEAAGVVFVTGEGGRLAGTALLVELLRADPARQCCSSDEAGPRLAAGRRGHPRGGPDDDGLQLGSGACCRRRRPHARPDHRGRRARTVAPLWLAAPVRDGRARIVGRVGQYRTPGRAGAGVKGGASG